MVVAFVLISATASAQPAPSGACPKGQVVTADTAGHCCWLGQVWSVTRQVCVGRPEACPPGHVADEAGCVPVPATSAAPQAVPPPVAAPSADSTAPVEMSAPAPVGVSSLTNEQRILKHVQMKQELDEILRVHKKLKTDFINCYIIGASVGGGLWLLGYLLNVMLVAVIPSVTAGQIASFWTFFGCALGGSLAFTALIIVATIQMIVYFARKPRVSEQEEELRRFDQEQGLSPEGVPLRSERGPPGPRATITVMRF
jgi:hypothetical protein